MKLTLVVPCFNEEESVIEFYSEVTRVFKDKVEDYELVFVNDGSRDKNTADTQSYIRKGR